MLESESPGERLASRRAVEQLGAEVARMAALVEGRFERVEGVHAGEIAELRLQMAQLIDGLAARIGELDQCLKPLPGSLDEAIPRTEVASEEDADLFAEPGSEAAGISTPVGLLAAADQNVLEPSPEAAAGVEVTGPRPELEGLTTAQPVTQPGDDPSPGKAKASIFAWLGRR